MVAKYIFIVIFVFIFSMTCAAEDSIYILLDINKGKSVVFIDSDEVKQENMYGALANSLRLYGRNREVCVLFNSKLNFSDVVNARGVIQAVGFSNIKIYYLSDDKKKMAEIEMNAPAVIAPKCLIKPGEVSPGK